MSYVTGNAMALDDLDHSRVELRFLEHALATTDFSAVITGVAQPQITRQSLKQLSVPVPPLDLQQRFAAIVESVEQQKASQRAHLEELDTLFASLQSRAFNGDL
jgi:type I restriction enzyme S subunit